MIVKTILGDDGASEIISAYNLKVRLDLKREPTTESSFKRCIALLFGKSGWEIQ